MRTVRHSCVLSMVFLFAWAQPARADIWDWLEQMSGPGPFKTKPLVGNWGPGNVTYTLFCRSPKKSADFTPFFDKGNVNLSEEVTSGEECLTLDFRKFQFPGNERFEATFVQITEMAYGYKIAPAIEVGGGIGWFRTSSAGVSGSQVEVSVPKVTVMPALFFDAAQKHRDWGFFQAYFRHSHILAEMDATNFGLKRGNENFKLTSDGVASAGFIIEPIALIHLVNRLVR